MSTLTQLAGGGIKSVQRGTITLPGVSSNTATITSVDTNKSMLNFLGVTESTSLTTNNALVRIALTNATTVTATRSTSTGTSIVSYEVIEFY